MVNEQLLHNWFYGNLYVREAAAFVFAFAMGAIPIESIGDWLSAGAPPAVVRGVRAAVPFFAALKGFVPTLIAAHGGGVWIGAGAAVAALSGSLAAPLVLRRRAGSTAFLAGIVLGIAPFAAGAAVAALRSAVGRPT